MRVSPDKYLNHSVKSWVAIALIGQWFFALYIFGIYALPALTGNSELTYTLSPTKGVNSESDFDSFMFFTHILPAIFMALSGLFQLFPKIRAKYPKFHRYNGRMFFTLGFAGAITGLYLSFLGNSSLTEVSAIGIRINGLLILIAIGIAWLYAVKRNFKAHQRFAIHSFILVNGVWSFRLYLFGWYLLNQGQNGNTNKLDGPADIAISFACYLLPMAIAELYFYTQRKRNQLLTWFTVIMTTVGAILTFIGIIAAGLFIWIPKLTSLVQAIF